MVAMIKKFWLPSTSASSIPRTLTAWAVFQFAGVNVSVTVFSAHEVCALNNYARLCNNWVSLFSLPLVIALIIQ